jgi:predicted nuclease of predicted toxin-antitoxin system
MKIKLDENLPHRLAPLLNALGHDVHTMDDEGLVGRADTEVWEAAQKESGFLITQDLDFSDSRKFASRFSPRNPVSSSAVARTKSFA